MATTEGRTCAIIDAKSRIPTGELVIFETVGAV
jgi:hypothetical protein